MELQPLLSDATPAEITLASLPSDIIRIVLQLKGQPLERLRLISPVWSDMIFEYLADRKNHPPLELVEFKSGGHAMKAHMRADWAPDNRGHFQHVFKGWINDPTADTVHSPYLQMRTFKTERWYLFFWMFVWTVNLIRFHISLILISPLFLAIFTAWRLLFIRPKVVTSCNRLRQMFIRCSSISKLRLELANRSALDSVISTLGDVSIGELIIVEKKCDFGFRRRIIKLVRAHKIDRLIISVDVFKDFDLRKFLLKVTETTKELIILERTYKEYEKIFGRTKRFWMKTARDVSDGSFAIQVLNGDSYYPNCDQHLMRLKITV